MLCSILCATIAVTDLCILLALALHVARKVWRRRSDGIATDECISLISDDSERPNAPRTTNAKGEIRICADTTRTAWKC